MDNMNLVYFSATGTTKSVLTSFAKKQQRNITEYDLLRQSLWPPTVFEADTPTVFAVPVYAGRVPSLCVNMLNQFKGNNTPAIAIVVYGNRDYDDALLELCGILNGNGFVVVAAAAFVAQHSIFPTVASGRPDNKDVEAIDLFSEKCIDVFKSFTGSEKIAVKGNSPYCEAAAVPIRPSGNAKCNACGICVKTCPTNAIEADKPRKTDKSKCIACAACIFVCPQKSRAFRGLMYSVASKAFTKNNTARKEPDIFYAN